MQTMETPVLIVGAGAAGLTSSLLLSRLGIANRVVERDHDEDAIGRVVGGLHDLADFLRVDPHRPARSQAPEQEVNVVVASIAAGDSLMRPLILLPSPRVMWRLTNALTGSPMVPSSIERLT